ncbi:MULTISPECIES: hypothetical protein [Rhizobium]|uniref:hypothetical protein n=1 Tax=Rhizobium TaxID=379 RepID=UPI001C82C8CA|nr:MULTISPECIES: hypothetical protein [Rhizobium]MBX4899699.1 hypothetical protein [Rhizobium bangladeshense]MBX5297590.1 hypothetical protein [Rhizobium sp. NLR15a]MBY3617872.1 hypothetical protein [Rhizobium bangladeshense]
MNNDEEKAGGWGSVTEPERVFASSPLRLKYQIFKHHPMTDPNETARNVNSFRA